MKVIVWVLFRRWLGKRFQPPQFGSHSGVGINSFGGGALRYGFRAHSSPARAEGVLLSSARLQYRRLDAWIGGMMSGRLVTVSSSGRFTPLGIVAKNSGCALIERAVTDSRAVIRRLHQLERWLATQTQVEAFQSLSVAAVVRERRRRRCEASGEPFEESPLQPISPSPCTSLRAAESRGPPAQSEI